MKEILLRTENLSKSFSSGGILQHVLKNIDLELYDGDFTVIMGASGAGKSTLLYALSGMDTPTLGTVTFCGTCAGDAGSHGPSCRDAASRVVSSGDAGSHGPSCRDAASRVVSSGDAGSHGASRRDAASRVVSSGDAGSHGSAPHDRIISDLTPDQLAVFRRSFCGFVFQQIYLIDGMSVMDNVLAAGLLVNKDRKALVNRARELFQAVGILEETQRKFPTQISGGEAQRVGIVRGLINSPRILFADEPTGALNSKSGLEVLDTLTRFNRSGQSVVMVTHDMRSARRGNRILYLKDGAILGECLLGKYEHGDEERHNKLSSFLEQMGW